MCAHVCTRTETCTHSGGQEGLPQRSGWEPRKGWSIPATSPASPPRTRQQLSEEELERLEEACDMALELNASKHRIYEYVESRMSFIAPNLSIIIGASTAAKIMGELGRGEGPQCPLRDGDTHPGSVSASCLWLLQQMTTN